MGLALNSVRLATVAWAAYMFDVGRPLQTSCAFALMAFIGVDVLVPMCGPVFLGKGLSGRDLNKVGTPTLPETMGAVPAVVYLLVMLLFTPFAFYPQLGDAASFPHNKLGGYLGAVLSLQSMVILGIADDFFDLRWRHKFFIPGFAAIPLLIVYFVDYGVTYVVVPTPLRPYLGEMVELGWLYYLYMAALSIFCTNSINILAGVNGVEVGQSVIIGLCVLANDLLYITGIQSHSHEGEQQPALQSHLLSAYFVLPFLGVSLGLLKHNWWPARVFVGDTYCYFAGMTFATIGILGHFSKTLLLFFVPQIFNFVLSVPQLFHIIPCPRHRLPRLQPNGKLDASCLEFTKDKPPTVLQRLILQTASMLGFVRLTRDDESGQIVKSTNFTLISMVLVRFGQMREDTLAGTIMFIQLVFGILGFLVRHRLARLIFTDDNRPDGAFYV
ncbi:tunicamycin resistance protein [Savitreella phatthalungensis]